jgi:cell division protein FtsB
VVKNGCKLSSAFFHSIDTDLQVAAGTDLAFAETIVRQWTADMHYRTERRMNEDGTEIQHHRSGHRHRRSFSSRLALFLGIALAIETVLLVVAMVRTKVAEQENNALELLERRSTAELDTLKPQINKLKQEIALLSQSRLPDLQPIEFDKVVEIDKSYVKNVVFTVAGRGDQKHYEYKVVVANSGASLVRPAVELLLFDRVGVLVGKARIGEQKDGTTGRSMLERGEIRSFSGRFEMTGASPPEYFRLTLQK